MVRWVTRGWGEQKGVGRWGKNLKTQYIDYLFVSYRNKGYTPTADM